MKAGVGKASNSQPFNV